jgi:hypothetical protein
MTNVIYTFIVTLIIVSITGIVNAQEFSVPFTVGPTADTTPSRNCGASNTPCGVPADAGGAPSSTSIFVNDSVASPVSSEGASTGTTPSRNCGASNTPCGVPTDAGGAPDTKSVNPTVPESN